MDNKRASRFRLNKSSKNSIANIFTFLLFIVVISFSAYAATSVNVIKLSPSPAYNASQTVTFLINITNSGDTNLTEVLLYDYYNSSLINFTTSPCAPYAENNSAGWILINATSCFGNQQLPPGQSFSLIIVNFTTAGMPPFNVTNFVQANATSIDGNFTSSLSNYTVQIMDAGSGEPMNVSIVKIMVGSNYTVGQIIPFNINITNYMSNPTPDGMFNLSDLFNPTYLNFTAASINPNITSTGMCVWYLPSINPGLSLVINANFTTLTNGSTNNTAKVTNPNNDTNSSIVLFDIQNDILGITTLKYPLYNPAVCGQTVEFIINVTNSEPYNITNILVNDTNIGTDICYTAGQSNPVQTYFVGGQYVAWLINLTANSSSIIQVNFSACGGTNGNFTNNLTITNFSSGAVIETASAEYSIINCTPPSDNLTISIQSPIAGYSYSVTNITINFSANPSANASTLWYYNESSNITCGSNPCIQNVTTTEGNHTFIFYANNTLGQIFSESRSFNVNLSLPNATLNLVLTGPENNENLTTLPIVFTFNITGTGDNPNCSLYSDFSGSWEINQTKHIDFYGPNNFTATSLSNGNYNWSIYCSNGLNDVWGSNRTFNYAITPQACNDSDADGYNSSGTAQCGIKDCDDNNADVKPGATENCTNNIDDNCNWLVDSNDASCGGIVMPSFGSFDFMKPPYAANGPGCYNAGQIVNMMNMPGQNCPGGKMAYDMGAVWVDQDKDFIYWQVLAPNMNTSKFCGGQDNLRIFVEFDADANTSTGCTNCFAGADYQFVVNLDGYGEMWVYNNTYCPNLYPNMSSNQGKYCFDYNASIPVYVNISKNGSVCDKEPSTIKVAVRKNTIMNITGLNFEMNTFNENNTDQNGGPFDQLRGGAGIDPFMGAGPKSQGAMQCFLFDNNSAGCDNATDDFTCRYNSNFNICEPDFANFNDCNSACFACANSTTCANSQQGNCQWMTGTPKGDICVEQFNPFQSGGDCNTDCYACFSQSQCTNSMANGGSTGYGGCGWFTDPFTNKSFCEVKDFKIPECKNMSADGKDDWSGCKTQAECEGKGWYWQDSAKNVCTKNATYELCFDGEDNDNNGFTDCDDDVCYTQPFCGSSIDTLTGQFAGQTQEQAMKNFLFQGMDNSPPVILGRDAYGDSSAAWGDIGDIGVKEGSKSVFFGTMLYNASLVNFSSPMCNGTGTNVLKILTLLDTDNNQGTGCSITADGTLYNGYEFAIRNEIVGDMTMTSLKCFNGTWTLNAIRLSSMPDLLCAQLDSSGVAAPMVQKADIGNPTGLMHILTVTMNSSWENMSNIDGFDSADGYYTIGSVDFKPVDCFADPTKCGAAFGLIGGGKYMPFEDCMMAGDEDLDGQSNCNDTDCNWAPWCSGNYNVSADKTAPKVTMSSVEELDDAAFVMWSTDEPTNGSILFYKTDSACQNLNDTITEPLPPEMQMETFKPWHNAFLGPMELGYSLSLNTTYFYKIKNVDKANNSGQSACLNFTTLSAQKNVQMFFNFTPGQNNYTNNMTIKVNNNNISIGNTTTFNQTSKANLTFSGLIPGGSGNYWEITFVNANIVKASTLDLTSSMLINFTGGQYVLGMTNGLWLEIAQNLGCENIIVRFPATGDMLYKCSDTGTDCQEMTSKATLLSSGGSDPNAYSYWQVPVSYGFSTYITEGENYTLNFTGTNYTQFNVTDNSTILINVTNGDNASRMYDFSLAYSGNALNYSINASMPGTNLTNVTFSAYEMKVLSLTFWASAAGTRNVNFTATLSNNSNVTLNSYDDMGSIIVNITDATPSPNFSVTKTASNQSIAQGSIVTYTINVTNVGQVNATNYHLYDDYNGSQINYLGASIVPVAANDSMGEVEWQLNLTTGQSYVVYANFTAVLAGNATNQIFVDDEGWTGTYGYTNTTITINSNVTTNNDSYEPDNNMGNASWIANDGTRQTHNFYPAFDVDFVKFNATKDFTYVITTYNNTDQALTDTIITLYNASGNAFAISDDIEYMTIVTSKIIFKAGENGTYYVKVEEYDGNVVNGSYDISVEQQGQIIGSIASISSTNVSRLQSFNVTTTAQCVGGPCGNVSAYLDPEKKEKANSQVVSVLETEPEVAVIVKLKDISQTETPQKTKVISNEVKAMMKDKQDAVISTMTVNEFKVKNRYSVMNGFSGMITKEGLQKLLNNPDVEYVEYDEPVQAFLDVSVPLINATALWNATISGGNYNGTGQTVCVIDTGINYTHADFGSLVGFPNAKVVGGYDYVNSDADPKDDHGHGTHCAGIIASEDATYRGVAPGARIVAIKALNSTGGGSESNIVAGIDWCVNNASLYNISVISMSLGGGAYADGNSCEIANPSYASSINNAIANGITVVIASGNDYYGYNTAEAVAAPGCIKNAITIGATTDADVITDFTNRNNLVDLLAPGSDIVATDFDSTHVGMSGTSMATPHVAGVIALLQDYTDSKYNRPITPKDAELRMKSTGISVTDTLGRTKLTFPRVDAYAAATSKGIIPTTVNATPFYTTSNNPASTSCLGNLSNGQSCNSTWTVIATEASGSYEFFTIYETAYGIYYTDMQTVNIADFSAPSLTIISPQATLYNNATILVNLTAIDNANVSSIWFYNGTANQSYTPGSPVYVTFSEGSNTLYAYANDTTGNLNTSSVTFNVDTTKPGITSATTSVNVTKEGNVTVTIVFNETMNTSVSPLVQLVGLASTVNASGSYSSNTTWQGLFAITDTNEAVLANISISGATDLAYNQMTAVADAATMVVDTITPAYLEYNTSAIEVNTTESIIVWANWTETYPANATLYVNGVANQTMSSQTYTNFSWAAPAALAETNATFFIMMYDLAGNYNQTPNMTVYVRDTTGPTATLVSPANNSLTNNNLITFRFNATDNLNSVANCTLVLDGIDNLTDTNITSGQVTSLSPMTLADGLHNWSIECFDGSNNFAASDTYYFTVDTIKPAVADNSGITSGYYSSTKIINITITDTNNFNATLYVNGTAVNTSTDTNSATLIYSLANDGNYSYIATATDYANNTNASATISNVMIDKTAPTITITAMPDYTNTLSRTVTGTFSEANLANITVNGTLATVNTTAQTYTATINLTEGNDTIIAIITDLAGTANNTTDWIVYDPTTPVATTYNTSAIEVNTTESIIVWANWTETYPANATLYVNGVANQTMSSQTYTNFSWAAPAALAETNATFFIIMYDLAGNYNQTSNMTVYVRDTTGPIATLSSPANNSYTNNNSVIFRFTPVDNLGSVANCSLYIDGVLNTSVTSGLTNGSLYSFSPITLLDAIHNWSITCYDGSNNVGQSDIYYFTLDTIKPAVIDNSGISAGYYNTAKLINITITDTYNFNATLYVNGSAVNTSSGTNSASLQYTLSSSDNYSYYIIATDIAGNINTTVTVSGIVIDTTMPTVLINSPASNSIQASRTFTINFTANDANYNYSLISVYFTNGTLANSTTSTSSGNQAVSLSVPSDGTFNITATTYDLAGNSNISTKTNISADTTAPSVWLDLTGTAGLNDWYTTVVGIYVNASDVLSGISYRQYNTGSGWNNFTTIVNISATTNVSYRAYDFAGLSNSSSQNIKIDSQKPVSTLSGISNNTIYNGNKNVTLTAYDNGDSGVNATKYIINAGNETTYNATIQFTSDGAYNITYWSMDNAGNNETARTLTFTIDTTAPSVTFATPQNGTVAGGSTYLVNLTTDASSIDLYVDGSLITTLTSSFLYNLSLAGYSDGYHNISAIAKDSATPTPNSNTNTTFLYVDKTAPSSTIVYPTTNYLTKTTPIIINGTSADSKSTVSLVQIYNGTAWVNATGTTSWNHSFSPVADGTYNIRTKASDQWSNTETPGAGIYIIYDATAPTISSVSASPNPISNTSTLQVTVYASDSNGIASVNATLNGTIAALSYVSGTQYTGTISPPADEGDYALNITVVDNAGNSAYNDSTTITVNNSASVVVVNPASGILKNGSTITINVTNANLAKYNSTMNTTQVTFENNTVFAIGGADGAFTLQIYTNSTTGVESTQTFAYTIDNTAPTIVINAVTSPTNLGTQTITGNYSDANIDYILVNGNTSTLGNGTFSKVVTLSEGNNTITAIAYDKVGNNATASAIVLKDTAEPVTNYTLSGTAGNNGYYTSDVNISFTATDALSSIAETQYDIGSGYTTGTSALLNATTTVYYRSIDAAGNNETEKSVTVNIDKTNPSVSNLTLDKTAPYNVNATIVIRAQMSDTNLQNKFVYIDSVAYNMTLDSGTTYKYAFTPTQLKTYSIYAYCTDIAGNTNQTSVTNITTSYVEIKEIITTPNTTIIPNFTDTQVKNNVQLQLVVNDTATLNATIALFTTQPTNTSTLNNSIKFVEITIDSSIPNITQWMLLKVYYNDSELGNITESTLGLSWLNTSNNQWVIVNTTNMDWVFGNGVDTTNNYVWANVSHFSTYGLSGSVVTTTTTTTTTTSTSRAGTGMSYALCTSEWTCSDWSECINGMQTRTCTKDTWYCSDGDKPSESTDCSKEIEEPTIPGQGAACTADVACKTMDDYNGLMYCAENKYTDCKAIEYCGDNVCNGKETSDSCLKDCPAEEKPFTPIGWKSTLIKLVPVFIAVVIYIVLVRFITGKHRHRYHHG